MRTSPEGLALVAVSGDRPGARFAVGVDEEGRVCAQAGSAPRGHRTSACGQGDKLTVVAFQTDHWLVIAGYAPPPAASVKVIIDGQDGPTLPLLPVEGQEIGGFGTLLPATPTLVEISLMDTEGDVIVRHFPAIEDP